MNESIFLEFEDGSSLSLKYGAGGSIIMEAKTALGPAVTALEIKEAEVQQIRAWLGKVDAKARGERGRL